MIEAKLMTEFKSGVEQLNDEQVSFIENELGISAGEISGFNDEELNSKVYEPMCDIEIAEAPIGDDEEETERCKVASDIVTILGNSLAEANGWFDEEASE